MGMSPLLFREQFNGATYPFQMAATWKRAVSGSPTARKRRTTPDYNGLYMDQIVKLDMNMDSDLLCLGHQGSHCNVALSFVRVGDCCCIWEPDVH